MIGAVLAHASGGEGSGSAELRAELSVYVVMGALGVVSWLAVLRMQRAEARRQPPGDPAATTAEPPRLRSLRS